MLDRFDIDYALCMYCGICVEVCPFDALFWSPEFEYSESRIAELLHDKDKLGEWMETVPEPEPLEIGAEVKGKKYVVAQNVVFGIIAVAMVIAAIGVVRSQNVVHAALYLVVVLAGARRAVHPARPEFVAWVQVLVYIGAIDRPVPVRHHAHPRADAAARTTLDNDQRWPAAVVVALPRSACSSALLVDAFGDDKIKLDDAASRTGRTVDRLDLPRPTSSRSRSSSMLLLAALVGAVVLARRD